MGVLNPQKQLRIFLGPWTRQHIPHNSKVVFPYQQYETQHSLRPEAAAGLGARVASSQWQLWRLWLGRGPRRPCADRWRPMNILVCALTSHSRPLRNWKALHVGILGTCLEVTWGGKCDWATHVPDSVHHLCEAFQDSHEKPTATGPFLLIILSLFPQSRVKISISIWNDSFTSVTCIYSFKKKKKSKNFLCLHRKKDTCNIVEKVLVLEVSLLANLIDSFQEKILSPRPLLLKQDDHVAQRHVVPAVGESPELQGKDLCRHGTERKSRVIVNIPNITSWKNAAMWKYVI